MKTGGNTQTSIGKIDASDAQSHKSGARSMRGSNGFGNGMPGVTGNGKSSYVVYEDPAAALNVSDDKWNAIVQENLRKFKDDREKARMDKIQKSKVIQEEQKKQIEAKKVVEM